MRGTMAKKTKPGKMSADDLRAMINKKAGMEVAHSLVGENPTEVTEWIPTGSRWLNSIICRGKIAGIPVGKISEIAGLEATGKSFLAAQAAANAQKMGMQVVYFDSESAIDPSFLSKAGCDLETLLYVQAYSVEFVLETIETIMASGQERTLFIWDSMAFTPATGDLAGDFNPQSSMALKARILGKAMSKLLISVANSKSTLLVLNQLKSNITRMPHEMLTTPYVTPGGKSLNYAYSLRIWLTGRKAKKSFVVNEKGYRIGSEVKAKIEKSRFGTAGRTCNFRILWGDDVAIRDEESWFAAIKDSEHVSQAGAWYSLKMKDGTVKKFQASKWLESLADPVFRDRVIEIFDEEIIMKFATQEGDAKSFYEVDE